MSDQLRHRYTRSKRASRGGQVDREHTSTTYGEGYFAVDSSYKKFVNTRVRLENWTTGQVRLINRLIPDLLTNTDCILEIGCGLGPGVRLFQNEFQVVGVDLSQYALQAVRSSTGSTLLAQGSGHSLPFRSNTADLALLLEVLEHAERPNRLLEEVHRCLKPGGHFVATTPNPRGDILPPYSAWHDRTHVSVYPQWRWREILEDCGFDFVRSWTIWSVPWIWRFSPRLSACFRVPWIGPTTLLAARKPVTAVSGSRHASP